MYEKTYILKFKILYKIAYKMKLLNNPNNFSIRFCKIITSNQGQVMNIHFDKIKNIN